MIVQIAISIFIFLELANVVALYFKPDFDKANAMAPFKQWEKRNEVESDLLQYMVYRVAGSKLTFIVLLLAIVVTGTAEQQLIVVAALSTAILTYYWKLIPLIHKIDQEDQIKPKGYSTTLDRMIAGFVLILTISGLLQFFQGW